MRELEVGSRHGIHVVLILTASDPDPARRVRLPTSTESIHQADTLVVAGSKKAVDAFNPAALSGLMCRELLSVGYDGRLYDCDFNQMLAIEPPGRTQTIFELDDLRSLEGQRIATARHCFGCAAGAGSSCGGSLA